MANPILNDRMVQQGQKAPGWAPPQAETQYFPPLTDGPVSSWQSGVMTVSGTISATAVLLVLLLVSAVGGWMVTGSPELARYPDGSVGYNYSMPPAALLGIVVGFGIAIFLAFKPHLAKYLAPVYALGQGFAVGSVSRMYETYYDGIVLQAAGATIAVFVVMLVLYRTNVIKVTDRFRRIVVGATLGIMVFYMVSFVISLFAGSQAVNFLNSPSLLGIGFSILVAGLAAFNLALDFDFIEKGAKAGLAKNYEWYAAFGLLITIVWLYLELLRLLAKMRQR